MDAPILRFDRYSSPKRPALLASRRVWLEIIRGRVRQRMRPVRGPLFLVGTSTDCDLILGDPSFPGTYAYLFVREAGIAVRWLGAGTELQLDGEAVETADLKDGDRLSFGPFELRVGITQNATTNLLTTFAIP